jgi:hypothetical protein
VRRRSNSVRPICYSSHRRREVWRQQLSALTLLPLKISARILPFAMKSGDVTLTTREVDGVSHNGLRAEQCHRPTRTTLPVPCPSQQPLPNSDPQHPSTRLTDITLNLQSTVTTEREGHTVTESVVSLSGPRYPLCLGPTTFLEPTKKWKGKEIKIKKLKIGKLNTKFKFKRTFFSKTKIPL